MRDTLNQAANDDDVRVFVLTGAGNFYSSGNDLSNFTNIPPEGPQKLAADSRVLLKYIYIYLKEINFSRYPWKNINNL